MTELQRQQAQQRARRRRPHPARSARIAAAGVGFTSMFGIVAALGWSNRAAEADTAAPAAVAQPAPVRVVIVVHHADGTTSTADAPTGVTSAVEASATALPAGVPIPLVAQPTVRVAPAAQPAVASTHGSR